MNPVPPVTNTTATAAPYQSFRGPPGPRALPLVGWRGNSVRWFRDPIAFMMRARVEYGDIVALARHEPRHLFVFGPEPLRTLLTDTETFHTIFETIAHERIRARRRGIGLVQMNGAQHKQQRRLMMPAFHKSAVATYRDDIVTLTRGMLERWQLGTRLDVAYEMQQLALAIASKTLLGLEVGPRARRVGELVQALLATPFFSPEVNYLPFDLPGTPYRRVTRVLDELERVIIDMIGERRASPDTHRDALAMLVNARDEDGSTMTDTELIGQTLTLLIAGHETTSNALMWTLLLLALHPQTLGALGEEVDGVLRGDEPTVESLARLSLLNHVCSESLRLFPPASLGSRVSTREFEFHGYYLPERTFLTFSPYVTHRIPELFPEPQRFAPARWDKPTAGAYAYIPFGSGPRSCIGSTFSMLELRLVLAMIVQRFRLALPAGARVDRSCRFTLAPKDGLRLDVLPKTAPMFVPEIGGNIREMIDLHGRR